VDVERNKFLQEQLRQTSIFGPRVGAQPHFDIQCTQQIVTSTPKSYHHRNTKDEKQRNKILTLVHKIQDGRFLFKFFLMPVSKTKGSTTSGVMEPFGTCLLERTISILSGVLEGGPGGLRVERRSVKGVVLLLSVPEHSVYLEPSSKV
jgi:hypothetical protein